MDGIKGYHLLPGRQAALLISLVFLASCALFVLACDARERHTAYQRQDIHGVFYFIFLQQMLRFGAVILLQCLIHLLDTGSSGTRMLDVRLQQGKD